MPDHRAAVSPLIKRFSPAGPDELRMAAEGLWRMRKREYQYVATGLLGRYHEALSLDDLPWLLDLVQKKSWWDTVDSLLKAIGPVVRRAGLKGKRAMDAAVKHEDFWVRRIAMLHQLGLARRGRHGAALPLRRAARGGKGVLHPQGDRLGAERLCMARLARRGQVPEVRARSALRADGSRGKKEFCGAFPARPRQAALDAAAAQAVACPYTGKEVDPAYEQRLFEL